MSPRSPHSHELQIEINRKRQFKLHFLSSLKVRHLGLKCHQANMTEEKKDTLLRMLGFSVVSRRVSFFCSPFFLSSGFPLCPDFSPLIASEITKDKKQSSSIVRRLSVKAERPYRHVIIWSQSRDSLMPDSHLGWHPLPRGPPPQGVPYDDDRLRRARPKNSFTNVFGPWFSLNSSLSYSHPHPPAHQPPRDVPVSWCALQQDGQANDLGLVAKYPVSPFSYLFFLVFLIF